MASCGARTTMMHRSLLVAMLTLAWMPQARAEPATDPPQVPLCMIGDSITWAQEGDYWRLYLLDNLPHLAFVGTHTAVLGYSHAGEGGNGTGAVLARLFRGILAGTSARAEAPAPHRVTRPPHPHPNRGDTCAAALAVAPAAR